MQSNDDEYGRLFDVVIMGMADMIGPDVQGDNDLIWSWKCTSRFVLGGRECSGGVHQMGEWLESDLVVGVYLYDAMSLHLISALVVVPSIMYAASTIRIASCHVRR